MVYSSRRRQLGWDPRQARTHGFQIAVRCDGSRVGLYGMARILGIFLLGHCGSPHCRAIILTLIGEEEQPARRSGERHCSG